MPENTLSPLRPSLPRLAFAAFVALAVAPAAAGPTNDDCLMCHEGTEVSEPFAASVHAPLACTDCHADLAEAELPHADDLAPVDCSLCHGDVVEAYGKSVHASARRSGEMIAASCIDCHGTHDILASDDPASRTYAMRVPQTCGRCHGTSDVIAAASRKEGDVYAAYVESVHGKGLFRSGLLVSAECTDCHGYHDVRAQADPDSPIARMNLPATCGACHVGIEDVFRGSIHGQKLAAGDPKAPTCEDCHTAHRIRRAEVDDWKLAVLQECGSCHEQSLTTYQDTFHGQVTSLGFTRVATCAACHGSHDIRPKEDAESRISGARRIETCQSCHPSANANFAAYDPHADKHDRARNPWLFWSGLFMKWLLLFVFAFFGVHTALWFSREVKVHGGIRFMRSRPPAGKEH